MKWFKRSNVKVDRVVCPCAIQRFMDARAEFLFLPEDQPLETSFFSSHLDRLFLAARRQDSTPAMIQVFEAGQ